MTRAHALLPVLPADLPSLEASLEHLVAAADESTAAGVPTTLVLATSADPAAVDAVLASWVPLLNLLDGVTLTVEHHPGARSREELRSRSAQGLGAALADHPADAAATLVLTTTCDVLVAPDWVVGHVRHHREGARASTGPVRGGGDVHELTANLAVRADLLPAVLADRRRVRLVHALTPLVATPRVTLPASP
ncbi:hypothetical protein [Kineococcus sp. SYSU DK001]|uniref:hypothetical protein n=1 Tax=Kineococcus sp. SYSU DK001 TaxID=3383122 RepID=UPI003D7D8CA8